MNQVRGTGAESEGNFGEGEAGPQESGFHLGILEVPQIHKGVLNFANPLHDCGGAEGGRACGTPQKDKTTIRDGNPLRER
jgi:hypothetical protein